jgi:valyl-tRNA synthetase
VEEQIRLAAIIGQLKALGCSYDWTRERFTMDEGYSRAVLTVFKEWYDKGLIYRGYRLVNWSPGAQSTVSDLEINYREVAGKLWHLKYPVKDSDEFIVVATTRPETMLGDTAVAVHPDDERYKHLHGKTVLLPLMNREIPIITDTYVDATFGSGAVKITPAHDPNDYEMGQRHGLEMITVIGFDAKMTAAAGEYSGQTREEARKAVVRALQAQDLLEKIDDYTHSVAHCDRTGTVIEPLLSEQWFVRMKELARPVADAIKMNRVHYRPDRFANTSLDWMENIRDWCISRQLWWGHRIPVYYGPNGEVKVSVEPITDDGWHQDEDVLDTWFSSALWPFAVLGWPDKLETEFYPTSVLITGRDILNLWVSRMILTSLYFVDDEIPFHDVLCIPRCRMFSACA